MSKIKPDSACALSLLDFLFYNQIQQTLQNLNLISYTLVPIE